MNHQTAVAQTSESTHKLNGPHPRSLEYWAEADGDAAAIVDHAGVVTYRAWNDAADLFAEALHRRGIRAGDRVAVKMRMHRDWFVVNRAIGKLGAEHVALNYRLTAGEAADLAADAGATAVVADDSDVGTIATQRWAPDVSIGVSPGSVPTMSEVMADAAPVRRYGPDQTALIIFTSGTTGRPKGVSFHDRVVADPAAREEYDLAKVNTPPRPDGSRVLLTLPLHHAAGPFEATATHQGGGTVYLLPRFDARDAVDLIATHRITQWMAVPTMLLRVRALGPETLARFDTGSIRTLYVGAAPVPPALKAWIVEHFGDDVLWEQYGSAETSAITFLTPQDQLRKPGSSGTPFPGVKVRIVDDAWSDVPTGETGEIAVSTPGMIVRYVGAPPMPPDVLSADGFYRTGDMGWLDDDGYLYLTDRRKDMVISGGVNLYPAEIEAAIVEHPSVVDCAVIGIPHEDLGEQPKAYLELVPGASAPSVEDLSAFLATRLARFKHPRAVEAVTELPRNPAGKVLKNELRLPYWSDTGRRI